MAEEDKEPKPYKAPSIEEQNPFGIHIPSEEERMEEAARIARFAEERILEQLCRQHPVVAAAVEELKKFREAAAAKKPKKEKPSDPGA